MKKSSNHFILFFTDNEIVLENKNLPVHLIFCTNFFILLGK